MKPAMATRKPVLLVGMRGRRHAIMDALTLMCVLQLNLLEMVAGMGPKNVIRLALGMKMMCLLKDGMSALNHLDTQLEKDICNALTAYGI
jgi:hypothetical protein